MKDEKLIWKTTGSKLLLHTPVFDVNEQHEISATGIEGDYIAMDAPDWVMVIPEYEGCFITVRQWRHAAEGLSVEFPGGVADSGEDIAQSAARELFEETGFRAGRLTKLGVVYPNPALFKNRFHVFLAEDLQPTGEQKLDDDEVLTYAFKPIDEVIGSFGSQEYSHALMGTALMFYLRYRSADCKE